MNKTIDRSLNLQAAAFWIKGKQIAVKYAYRIPQNFFWMFSEDGKRKREILAKEEKKKRKARDVEKMNKDFLYRELTEKDLDRYGKDYEKEIDFIKKTGKVSVFPYEFVKEYNEKDVEMAYDFRRQMYYVLHEGKRLYFPDRFATEQSVRSSYNQLRIEGDFRSPHVYTDRQFSIEEGSVFVDVGAAEAIMTLSVIDKIKKAYIFEGEAYWVKALRATFEPYQDKIEIIRKYVSDKDTADTVTLDSIVKDVGDRPLFIKIDVEGMEMKILKGAFGLLGNKNMRCACCTYHEQDACNKISLFFDKISCHYRYSNGYMLFWGDERQKEPYFRKGVIYAYYD